jgi:L-iditol 2-dehydrogenase
MLPTTMSALLRDERGLCLLQHPVPTPRPDELLIKLAYAGICRTDIQAAQGKLISKTPIILGHEFSGTVVGLGSAVKDSWLGARVAVFPLLSCGRCDSCTQGRAESCLQSEMLGLQRDGCFAEYIAVPVAAAYLIPDSLSLQQAAYAEPVAAALSVSNVSIKKDAKCLIYGRNRIAQLLYQILTTLGVEDVQCYQPGVDRAPREGSLDVIVETIASTESVYEMMLLLRPRGMLLLKSRLSADVRLDVALAVRRELCLQAVNYAPFAEALSWLGRLQLTELLGSSYALQDYEAAFSAACASESKKIFFSFAGS